MKRNNSGHTGPGKQASTTKRELVVWVDQSRIQHVEAATPSLLHRDFENARRIRTGYQYKAQRNYHGTYWFSQTGSHVWYESLFEMTALMSMDFTGGITAVASQSMMMQFRDGTVHYPDLFAVHRDGRKVVIDVRPKERIDDAAKVQFAQTKELCDLVGWGYQLFTEIDPVAKANLEWLSGYRHPRYLPNPEVTNKLVTAARRGRTFRDLIKLAGTEHDALGAMAVYSLLWRRILQFDMTTQLTTVTTIHTTEKDN
jgi:hypothetical protein